MRLTPPIKKHFQTILDQYNSGIKAPEIAINLGISRATVYRILNNLPRIIAAMIAEQL